LARELIEARGDTIYENEEVWKDLVQNNVVFNLARHLRHMGIPSPETRSHGASMDEYSPEEKPWIVSGIDR